MEPLVVSKQEQIRPTISFAISGEGIPLTTLKQIGRQVENDIRAIDGISQISISGYPEEEIEIAVIEENLLAYNLTFSQITQAVANSNLLITGGTIKTRSEDFLIRANNKKYFANELANLIIRAENQGTTIRLKDVAVIRDRFSETPNQSFFNENISVNFTINSTNSEDLISSADKIKAYIKAFNQKQEKVKLNVLNDRSITLTQRTQLLSENALIGVFLVLIFLSLFLNTRLAFWVAFGLPISFLGMFIFAGYFDVTINVLSLFGMIIVIGILVDDGIVIAENIYQHYEKRKISCTSINRWNSRGNTTHFISNNNNCFSILTIPLFRQYNRRIFWRSLSCSNYHLIIFSNRGTDHFTCSFGSLQSSQASRPEP